MRRQQFHSLLERTNSVVPEYAMYTEDLDWSGTPKGILAYPWGDVPHSKGRSMRDLLWESLEPISGDRAPHSATERERSFGSVPEEQRKNRKWVIKKKSDVTENLIDCQCCDKIEGREKGVGVWSCWFPPILRSDWSDQAFHPGIQQLVVQRTSRQSPFTACLPCVDNGVTESDCQ
jgi:hypothetical protein